MCDSPSPRSITNSNDPECSDSGSSPLDSVIRADTSLLDMVEDESGCASTSKDVCWSPYRSQLEQDVQKLQEQLQEEMKLHTILQHAIDKNAVQLSNPSCLQHHAQELLNNIVILEVAVSKLEHEMVSLHFQLSQERNERRLAEYRLKQSSLELHSICSSDISISERLDPEDGPSECSEKFPSLQSENKDAAGKISSLGENKPVKAVQAEESSKLPRGLPPKGLWDFPNRLSEEMVRCMKNIFISLADSAMPCEFSSSQSHFSSLSPHGNLSSSSWLSSSDRSITSSWVRSPQIDIHSNLEVLALDNACDPYRVRGKLSWADVGNYGLATEVSWMSVGKKQLEYAAGALRKFRTLVEQLAKVNPIHLNMDEKLAFWINLYNAMIMHAYLAYGVPRSDLKFFSLMQKAAYTVGGHSFSAAAIEYAILKMKPPLHRPQIALLLALHKLKLSEEKRKSAVDVHEPLVAFALSCGMHSSPAVKVFTAKNVREELHEAQRDFIRASVGVSNKGKLLVPKMLHCFAKGFVDDGNLAVWISHYLPPHQAAFVERCMSQRRQSLLSSRNSGILPFDSHFRYLFLPDKIPGR